MNRKAVVLICIVAVLCGLIFYGLSVLGLPRESRVLQTFYTQRQTFQQLRDMMLAEQTIVFVGDGWVQTDLVRHRDIYPSDPDFPEAKYQTYRALLKHAHALALGRAVDPRSEIYFLLGRAGFAGDSVHIGVCWCDHPPEPLVASFKSYRQSLADIHDRRRAYQRIDGDWYLWTDAI